MNAYTLYKLGETQNGHSSQKNCENHFFSFERMGIQKKTIFVWGAGDQHTFARGRGGASAVDRSLVPAPSVGGKGERLGRLGGGGASASCRRLFHPWGKIGPTLHPNTCTPANRDGVIGLYIWDRSRQR